MTLEITALDALRSQVAAWRGEGATIGVVPTMGALHRGHLTLVETAKKRCDRVIVSIFVNPTQFGPNEDFSRYPRPLSADLEQLRSVGADAAWLPDVATMYPEGFATSIHVAGISEPLDGQFRPGHFDGVATVVAKLFNQVTPDLAFFGEKDYQQLCLIKRLVNDLNMNIKVVGVPTVRESDGLAMSSRNQYLNANERKTAIQISTAMHTARDAIKSGRDITTTLREATAHLLAQGFRAVDYFDLRDANNLSAVTTYSTGGACRLLVAAHLGTTRLIDNIEV